MNETTNELGDELGPPEGNPAHPHWQGHTHDYPEHPDDAGVFTCRDCGMRATLAERFPPDDEAAPGD